MSRAYGGTPTRGEWYQPNPGGGPGVGQRKIEHLQRQIAAMETDMRDRSALMHKLQRLQELEREKQDAQEKVLERHSRNGSRNNSPRMLQSEMERLYGRDVIGSQHDRKSPSVERSVIENVIKQRTKEYSTKQQESALKAKYLDKERKRLQEARERVAEQRRYLESTSPHGKTPFSFHNDRVYMNYQPYHTFENKEERIRDSFVLPIKEQTFQVPRNTKFRLKFVPVSIGDNSWAQYNERLLEESNKEEVDSAIQAFQNFAARHNARHKQGKKPRLVKYVPEFLPNLSMENEYETRLDENRLPQNYFIGDKKRTVVRLEGGNDHKLSKWKQKESEEKSKLPLSFQDSMRFTSVHESYRHPDYRMTNRVPVREDKYASLYQSALNDINSSLPLDRTQKVFRKVKYKSRPAEYDTLIHGNYRGTV